LQWKRTHTFTDCEGFSFIKKISPQTYVASNPSFAFVNGTGSAEGKPNIKILLYMRHDPPIYHLSQQLKKVILTSTKDSSEQLNIGDDQSNELGPAMSLNHILTALWNYILVIIIVAHLTNVDHRLTS
jgi:hypothetical protein